MPLLYGNVGWLTNDKDTEHSRILRLRKYQLYIVSLEDIPSW